MEEVDTVPKSHNKPNVMVFIHHNTNITMGIRIIRRCMGDFNQTYMRAG